MPVLIAGSMGDSYIIRPLAMRLLEDGGEVRCYLEDDDFELRQSGCKIAIGDLTDDFNLEAALTNVHTFIPILPDPVGIEGQEDLEKVTGFARAASDALRASSIAQLIFPVSAVHLSTGELGQTYSDAAAFFDFFSPAARLVIGLVWGEGTPLWEVAPSLGSGTQIPVLKVEDIVAGLAAADDKEDLQGRWELAGQIVDTGVLRAQSKGSKAASALVKEALSSNLTVGNSYLDDRVSAMSRFSPVISV